MDFRRESLAGLAARVRAGDVSARELVQHALDRIEDLNPSLNAFVAVDPEQALAGAAGVDEKAGRGQDPGPLAGVPLGVKDTEDAAGYVTTWGSAAFVDDPPAPRDSAQVARLRAAGCVVVGKTNTSELAHKGETDNPVFGITRNPWDPSRTSGGSSGGSAVAVAAGMVPLATGSDEGGSIRIPSAFCGLTGMKASLGRVPHGDLDPPMYHHLSNRGPMARTARDVTLALGCAVGPDPMDIRALPMPDTPWRGGLRHPAAPLRVAWSPTLGYADPEPEVRSACEQALRVLDDLGAEVTVVDPVFDEDPRPSWLALVSTYQLRRMQRFRGTETWSRLDPLLADNMESHAGMSAADLVRHEDLCHRLNVRLVELFHHYRLLLTPTTAHPAFPCGSPPERVWSRFTYPFNMTRSPAGTVCAGFTSAGLPVGLQVIGPQHGDAVVLRALAALEDALGLDPVAPV